MELTAELIQKYDIHADIVAKVADGTLVLIYEDNATKFEKLCFEVPALKSRKTSIYLYWHGANPETWDVENIRFWVEEESNRDNNSEDIWNPESEGHDENVDEFLYWLETELED